MPQFIAIAPDFTDATASSLTSVTSASFAARSGQMYAGMLLIGYETNATTTGALFTLDVPGVTDFGYQYHNPLSTTVGTDAFEEDARSTDTEGTVSATSAATAGNMATMHFYCRPSAAGEIQLQVDTEVTVASAVVVKCVWGFAWECG